MRDKKSVLAIMAGLVIMTLASCGTTPELKVNYSLPQSSSQLRGHDIFLGFEDNRPNKQIFGHGAQEEFKRFPGNFSFSVAQYGEQGFKIGLYDIKSMFKEAVKRRLESQGMRVSLSERAGRLELIISLQEFSLDLVKRKWRASMTYEARLIIDGKVRSRQTVSGNGERIKIIRHDQADILMGEVFTDIINKLDVYKMFRKTGIIS
jgi:uncharacterized lipoprotein YajG